MPRFTAFSLIAFSFFSQQHCLADDIVVPLPLFCGSYDPHGFFPFFFSWSTSLPLLLSSGYDFLGLCAGDNGFRILVPLETLSALILVLFITSSRFPR